MSTDTFESRRERLTFDRVEQRSDLLRRNVLIADPQRQRPFWFDGRFLAGADLKREQDYFLLRQSDLGRAAGEGVAEGLLVTESVDSQTRAEILVITAGFGFTDTGELVSVPGAVRVNPADIPRMQQLDAAFGLEVIPNASGLTRTGLFVLALRPVEWTANPIAAYPTTLNGQRHAEDADIVEGAAVCLVPWVDDPGVLDWERRRARAARDIFAGSRQRGALTGTLPVALVALRGNVVEWVDPYLVRRELGADRRDGLDFGFGKRALREAHLLQYEHQLGDLLAGTPAGAFAASDHFDVLPPAGRLPAGAVVADSLTQRFFPTGIDVEVSFVPEDEIPVLLEESFLLPPIDLTAGPKALIGTSVLILVPLTRLEFNTRRDALAGRSWKLAFVDPQLKAEATPFDLLFARTPEDDAREAVLVAADGTADTAAEVEWRALLRTGAANGSLWYIRRRHLPVHANVPGNAVSVTSPTV